MLRIPIDQFRHTKLAYNIEEAAGLLSLSRAQLYRLMDIEEIPSVKIGKLRRITHVQLDDYIRRLEQQQGFVRL